MLHSELQQFIANKILFSVLVIIKIMVLTREDTFMSMLRCRVWIRQETSTSLYTRTVRASSHKQSLMNKLFKVKSGNFELTVVWL